MLKRNYGDIKDYVDELTNYKRRRVGDTLNPILGLPGEIWELVISNLNALDALFKLSYVNKLFRNAVSTHMKKFKIDIIFLTSSQKCGSFNYLHRCNTGSKGSKGYAFSPCLENQIVLKSSREYKEADYYSNNYNQSRFFVTRRVSIKEMINYSNQPNIICLLLNESIYPTWGYDDIGDVSSVFIDLKDPGIKVMYEKEERLSENVINHRLKHANGIHSYALCWENDTMNDRELGIWMSGSDIKLLEQL
jgi:hypothetical protein